MRETLAHASISHAQMADTLHYLRKQNMSVQVLSGITHLSLSQIRHYCRLSKKLSPAVKQLLHVGKISLSLAKAIASVALERQEACARDAIMKGVSVHKFRDKEKVLPLGLDTRTQKYFEQIEHRLSEQTGIVLEVLPEHNNKHAGIIKMRYSDLKDFDHICDRLQVKLDD